MSNNDLAELSTEALECRRDVVSFQARFDADERRELEAIEMELARRRLAARTERET